MSETHPTFSFEQIQFIIRDLQPYLPGFIVKNCIGSNPSRFTLILQKNEIKERLFFCLEKPYLRFHPIRDFKENHIHKHPLQDFLSDTVLIELKSIDQERILIIKFRSNSAILSLIIEFFPRHPNYYLVDENNHILFSLRTSQKNRYDYPEARIFTPQKAPLIASREMEAFYSDLEAKFLFEHDKNAILSRIRYGLKRYYEKQKKLELELKACLNWEIFKHEGELLKANYSSLKKGLKEITVWDWLNERDYRIEINPSEPPQDVIKNRFRKSKKLQKGIPFIEEQLTKNRQSLASLQARFDSIEKIQFPNTLPSEEHILKGSLQKQAKPSEKKEKARPYRTFLSSTGIEILVGKSAKDNENLTFSIAKGLDWWLHARGFAGSHVIIRTLKGQEPDQETLADALQLALHFSKAKQQGEAEICVTQRKFVTRLGKNRTGTVQISRHKNIFIKTDENRYRSIKERTGTL